MFGNYIYDKAWEYLIDKQAPATPVNQPPVVKAGADETVALFWNYKPYLDANWSKDPDGWMKSFVWTKVSGPDTYSIVNPNLSQTRVGFTGVGTYVFRVTGTDNLGASASDDKQIIVTP